MTTTLYDNFADAVGAYPNYDTYDAAQRTQLGKQKHIDIRSFEQDAVLIPYTMFDLDALFISPLDGQTMSRFESGHVARPGENWTAGTVGPQSDRANFNGLALTCTSGANITTSITQSLALTSFFATDYISVALPEFPLTSLTLDQCFLDLTSEPTGDFATGPTDSLPFSSSTSALIAGDCEARFPLSLLSIPDITGVRFRFQATGACTFRCLAIRCLASDWMFAPIDQNTLYDRLAATVPPSGGLSQPYSFPIATDPVTPQDWPILLRSDGAVGPTMVDMEVGSIIHTGQNTAENTLTYYFRELQLQTKTMAALDALTMGGIEAGPGQPDYTVQHLDDFANTHYLGITFQWGTASAVRIYDQDNVAYGFDGFTIETDLDYYFMATLEGNSIRVAIYRTSFTGEIDWSNVVFDSTRLIDGNFVRRRRGRFGWYAQLNEGDTNLRSLRPRSVTYSEYRSAPLATDTPVDGARIYVDSTPDKEFFDGAIATSGATLALDVIKSNSGRGLRVSCDGNHSVEGFHTSEFRLENLTDSLIVFDALAPSSARLTGVLVGEGRVLPLHFASFPANQWTHFSIPLSTVAQLGLPGTYVLYIVQAQKGQNTWYIDNLSIRSRAVTWSGRGQAADPWRMNDPAWIKFGQLLNSPTNGALLGRGQALQIRGQVLREEGALGSVQILPQYSTLGNFIWSEQAPPYSAGPTASIEVVLMPGVPTGIILTGSGTSPNGIAQYYWTLGDGNDAYGKTLSYTYLLPGTYVITLVVIDGLDQKRAVSQEMTVPVISGTTALPLLLNRVP